MEGGKKWPILRRYSLWTPLRVRSTIQAATIHVSCYNAMHRNQF